MEFNISNETRYIVKLKIPFIDSDMIMQSVIYSSMNRDRILYSLSIKEINDENIYFYSHDFNGSLLVIPKKWIESMLPDEKQPVEGDKNV